MASTLYSAQRVNFKPKAPIGVNKFTDPKKVLIESLKKMMDKKQQRIMSQNPAAVMGAVTNPTDIAKGMKGNLLGNVEIRAKMIGGK